MIQVEIVNVSEIGLLFIYQRLDFFFVCIKKFVLRNPIQPIPSVPSPCGSIARDPCVSAYRPTDACIRVPQSPMSPPLGQGICVRPSPSRTPLRLLSAETAACRVSVSASGYENLPPKSFVWSFISTSIILSVPYGRTFLKPYI